MMAFDLRTLYRQSIDYVRSYRPTTHGSARFQPPAEIGRNKDLVTPQGGHFLGWIPQPGEQGDLRLYANQDGHSLTAAPTGGGKGTCQVLTNLLSYSGSTLVMDISSENYHISARWRASLGQVLRFAPWAEGGHRWNPIDHIDCSDSKAAEEATVYLGSLMVVANAGGTDYWISAARTQLELFLLYVASAPLSTVMNGPDVTARNMAEVVRLLSLSPDLFEMLLDRMAASPMPYVRFCAGSVRQAWRAPEQFAGVHGNLLEQVKPWASTRIAEATAQSDFRCEALRTPGTTLYVGIPPDFLKSHASVVRTLVGCAMRELKNSADKGPPVLFMLDEFPSLGTVEPIADNLAYLRKYGVRFWWFIQDLAQLKQHYPAQWQSFIANSTYQSYFGISDLETAKMISERVGTATVGTRSYNQSTTEGWSHGSSFSSTHGRSRSSTSGAQYSSTNGTNDSYTTGTNESLSGSVSSGATLTYHARRLVTPEEVLSLHRFEQILFVRGMPPIRAALLPYYEHRLLAERADKWLGKDQG